MPETGAESPDSPKPPRFPWGPSLLFAACLAAAAWTWMRYSYCWPMTPDQAVESVERMQAGRWPVHAYVELDCGEQAVYTSEICSSDPGWRIWLRGFRAEAGLRFRRGRWSPFLSHAATIPVPGGTHRYRLLVLERASRLHGASVVGLVVAAFGGFVFVLDLRRWLLERRAGGG